MNPTCFLIAVAVFMFLLGLPLALSHDLDWGKTGAALFQCWGMSAAFLWAAWLFRD